MEEADRTSEDSLRDSSENTLLVRTVAMAQNLRVAEVVLMTGFWLIGALFAAPEITPEVAVRGAVFLLGVTALCLAIYSINSWLGFTGDRGNPRMEYLKSTSVRVYVIASVVWTVLALVVLTALDTRLLFAGCVSLVMWTAYSFPRIGLKGVPLAGTAVHVVMQILHFHMGYLLFETISWNSFAISIYFALVFAGGHLNHEAMDHESDERTGVYTGSAFFGRRYAVLGSFATFSAATFYWTLLWAGGMIRAAAFAPFAVAYVVQAASWLVFRPRLDRHETIASYRRSYRMAYLGAGLAFAVLKFTGSGQVS